MTPTLGRLLMLWLVVAGCACGSAPSSGSSTATTNTTTTTTTTTSATTTTPTTPTFSCAELTSDPLDVIIQRCHDLTGDGVVDTQVTTSGSLLHFTGAVNRDITLNFYSSTARIMSVTSIGQYVGGPLSEVVVRVDDPTTDFFSAVYVIDPEVLPG